MKKKMYAYKDKKKIICRYKVVNYIIRKVDTRKKICIPHEGY